MKALLHKLDRVDTAGLIRDGEKMALVPWSVVHACKAKLEELQADVAVKQALIDRQGKLIQDITADNDAANTKIKEALNILQHGHGNIQ